MYNDVAIIIPAYNEEKSVGNVVTKIRARLGNIEIIVVNDGSTDRTSEVARLAGSIVLEHNKCRGYGAALKTGLMASKGEYALFCDADGQHSVEDIIRLLAERAEFDMVVGARDGRSHVSLIRAPGKFILRHFANFLAGEIIPDLNCGLRIIRKQILLKYIHLMPDGFSFSTTSTFALLKKHYRIKWIDIVVSQRIGTSSVRQLKHGPQTLMLILRLTVLFEPLKVFLSVAGGLFVLSCISLLVDLIGSIDDSGISDTTVLLYISCLIIFMFGLLCDQVSALRREIHE